MATLRLRRIDFSMAKAHSWSRRLCSSWSEPEQDGGDDPHRPVVLGALLVARGEPPELLAAPDEPLHQVAGAIGRAVEGAAPPLIALAGDRHVDPVPPGIAPDLPTAVALAADDAPGPSPRPPAPRPLDRPLLHEPLEGGGLVSLAGGEQQRQQLAPTLHPQVDLCAEAAPATPECFRRRVPA